jgi:branched-chain amino acid aminotransferase
MKVILNGALVDLSDSLSDEKGWMKGSGVFETIKTVDNKPWALSRHMRRAVSSAQRLGIAIPTEDYVRGSVERLLEHERFEEGVLRLAFSSDGNWSAAHISYEGWSTGAHVVTYKKQVPTIKQPIKSFPYDHRTNIFSEVKAQGADEAIVLNEQGQVSEGSVTNLLFLLDGDWITPPISDGVLPGVMRALVIEYCGVLVRSISASDLPSVQSGFLLSSLRIAQPIASIDGRELIQSPDFQVQIEAMALRTSVG